MMRGYRVHPTSLLSGSRWLIPFLARLATLGYNALYAHLDSSILIKPRTITKETLIP
jgi:hypothetical protein